MKRSCPRDVKREESRRVVHKRVKVTAFSTATTDDINITEEAVCASTSVSIANAASSEADVRGAAGSSSPGCSCDAAATCSTTLQDPSAGEGNGTGRDTANNQPLIPELNNASVCMRDKGRVETIIRNMQTAGPNTLQVISDFDMTLTRFAHEGKRCPTTYNILHSSNVVSEDRKSQMSQLLDHYYPIEIDSSMSVEEKIPHMEAWWTQAHALLIEQGIRKDDLARAVRESGAMLREGYRSFFDVLQQNSVPLLIFSAGLGDILEEVITDHGVFHPNVRVFSNYMDYDQDGVVRAFKGQLIHTFNKREGALQNTRQFVHDRTNVLLLGDSLGDLNMADGVKDLQNILRIGYLNDKVEERKEAYVSSYDIVLVKDETLDVPNAILNYVTAK